jgi:hypothetical protein
MQAYPPFRSWARHTKMIWGDATEYHWKFDNTVWNALLW